MTVEPINLFDFEARAEQILPHDVWDFVAAGAFDEVTVKRNRTAFNAVALRPRFMLDIENRDLSTTILGQKVTFPVMIAPAGGYGMVKSDGDLAAARAAGGAGTIMALSTGSNNSLEEVSRVATGPLWFQLFHYGRESTELLVHRAEEAGYVAICLTVDIPAPPGLTERDVRNQLVRPEHITFGNFTGEQAKLVPPPPTDPGDWGLPPFLPLKWSDMAWLRSLTSLPLVMKGIRTSEDARLCVENGLDGIVVSNHGAKQIDGTLSSIETLPEIAEAVQGRAELYLDSGIRRGADVLRSLALGARAVLIGRPVFWGLAVDGEAGVRKVLELLRSEVDRAMAHCGATDIEGINRSMVALPGESGWVHS
jgi:4-hydroxymandelate oxidase